MNELREHNQSEILNSLLKSLACQVLALAIASFIWFLIASPYGALVAYIVAAFFIARFLELSVIWTSFNILLVPLCIALILLDLPPWLFGAFTLVALLIYLPTLWTRVPYYPTAEPVYEKIIALLPPGEIHFLDIGCGFGRLLSYLASRRPESTFSGVELSPLCYLFTKIRALITPGKVKVSFCDLWKLDLSSYQVVYAFLSPTPMPALSEKIQREMRPGSIFVSNSFPLPIQPDQIIEGQELKGQKLFVYFIKYP